MQPSFFDYAMEYQGGKKSTKFLSEMKELIPFEAIEKLLVEKSIYKPNKGKQGRPSTPANILVAFIKKLMKYTETKYLGLHSLFYTL